MIGDQPDLPPATPAASNAARPAARPVPARVFPETSAVNPGLLKPRVKMVETSGDLTPAGASFTPPTPAPLPERRAGLYLFLALTAAAVALVFVVLLAAKL